MLEMRLRLDQMLEIRLRLEQMLEDEAEDTGADLGDEAWT